MKMNTDCRPALPADEKAVFDVCDKTSPATRTGQDLMPGAGLGEVGFMSLVQQAGQDTVMVGAGATSAAAGTPEELHNKLKMMICTGVNH